MDECKRRGCINKNSNKIPLDKYYTSPELAEYVVSKTKEIIGEENITEYLEPSAGGGVFLDYLDKPYLAYDIEPEDDRIIKQDYLKLELNYKKGRCIIGNPPFGNRSNLVRQFYNKSIENSDYISFILPIKFHNNSDTLYKFDLLHSEDLGLKKYSGVNLHCCFNIFKRPTGNKLNKKPNYKLKSVDIISSDPRQKIQYDDIIEYDLRMVGWGAKAGKIIPNDEKRYADEYKIIISNKKYKDEITDVLKHGIDLVNISTPRINKYTIYKYLKEQIPELE
jgi:hypothetical protein